MKALSNTLQSDAVLASGSRFAACAAAWCGVHCALTPVLVLAAPALALSEGVEVGVAIATITFGAGLLLLGPGRTRVAVIGTFVGGAMVWAASLAGWLEPAPEALTSALGSVILAAALFWSARLCHDGACASCAEAEGRR